MRPRRNGNVGHVIEDGHPHTRDDHAGKALSRRFEPLGTP